jgi:hypothetical protein
MAGRNYNQRMNETGQSFSAVQDAAGAALRGAGRDPFRVATAATACTCQHPAGAHEGNAGCLHGWSDAGLDGCLCEGSPPQAAAK